MKYLKILLSVNTSIKQCFPVAHDESAAIPRAAILRGACTRIVPVVPLFLAFLVFIIVMGACFVVFRFIDGVEPLRLIE